MIAYKFTQHKKIKKEKKEILKQPPDASLNDKSEMESGVGKGLQIVFKPREGEKLDVIFYVC